MKAKNKLEEILSKANATEKTDFVTDRFGNRWKEHAMKHYSMNTVLDIAHRQGRIAILLEKEIEALLEQLEEPKTIPSDKEIEKHLEAILQDRYPVFSQIDAERQDQPRRSFGLGFYSAINYVKKFVNQQ